MEEYGRLKMRLFLEISNVLHGKQNEDWMSIIHASAVTDGKNAVVFSADSGAGKSTLATLLQTREYSLLGDDFVPVDMTAGLVYPFPAAISVKSSGRNIIESYNSTLFEHALSPDGSEHPGAWFLPPLHLKNRKQIPVPVSALIFLQYNPEVGCNFSAVDRVSAFSRFHKQAWISDKRIHVESFLEWLDKIKCYELIYSDIDKAMDQVERLFKKNRTDDHCA